MEVLRNIAQQRNAPLYEVDSDGIVIHSSDIERQTLTIPCGSTYSNGYKNDRRHQVVNAATALTALTVLKTARRKITNTSIYNGMKSSFRRIEIPEAAILLDGAHNANGASGEPVRQEYFSAGRSW